MHSLSHLRGGSDEFLHSLDYYGSRMDAALIPIAFLHPVETIIPIRRAITRVESLPIHLLLASSLRNCLESGKLFEMLSRILVHFGLIFPIGFSFVWDALRSYGRHYCYLPLFRKLQLAM